MPAPRKTRILVSLVSQYRYIRPPPLSPPSHIHNALPVPHWRCHLPLNRDMSVHSETWPPQGSERKLTKSHDAPRPNGGIATFNPPSRHMAASTVLLLEDLSRPFPKDRRGGGGLDNAPAKRASWAVQPLRRGCAMVIKHKSHACPAAAISRPVADRDSGPSRRQSSL